MKYIKFIFLILGILLLDGCKAKDEIILEPVTDFLVGDAEHNEGSDVTGSVNQVTDSRDIAEETKKSIMVYICGAVKEPGVYELEPGSRICDGIAAAGGLLENSAVEYVNLARILQDEEQVYIPTCEEIVESKISVYNGEDQQDSGLVNINTADEEALCTLPGVGETRARAIIDFREENGSFNDIEEIMNVEGIKNGLFEKLKGLITVR